MKIKHEQLVDVFLAVAAEWGQAGAADAITEEYYRQGGGSLCLVPGKTWANQQNIYHRWLKGETPQQQEKIRLLFPALLGILPRDLRVRVKLYDSLQRSALLAARDALGVAIDAHDDAKEAVYIRAYHSAADSPKFH